MSTRQNEPGVYAKGDSVKVANTPSQAVALVFDGYTRRATEDASSVNYRELQTQARVLGIPANQSAAALTEAIDAAVADPKPTGDSPADES